MENEELSERNAADPNLKHKVARDNGSSNTYISISTDCAMIIMECIVMQ